TGGDWFYVQDDDERMTLIIGDVTGHGTAPALVTASVAGATAVLELHRETPDRVMRELNRVVRQTGYGHYCMTCLCMQIDKRSRVYRMTSAAHPNPLSITGQKVSPLTGAPSRLLGQVDNDHPWRVIEGTLAPSSVVFMYTDGLFENRNANRQPYGMG